jgi:hypothetical protein
MRRLAGLVVGVGVLAAVGCRSNPCEPSFLDRLFGRQPAMMMGEPCPCPCPCAKMPGMEGIEGGMEMAYEGGPIFSAPPAMGGGPGPPRADTTSQPRQLPPGKGYARPMPYTPERDGK